MVNVGLPISVGLGIELWHWTRKWFGVIIWFILWASMVFNVLQCTFGTSFAKKMPYSLQIAKSLFFPQQLLWHPMWRFIAMPRCTHVPNLRPFGQCLPRIWPWSITFALLAMNLLPCYSYLWRDVWIIYCNSAFLISMGIMCETKEVCQGFTFFDFFFWISPAPVKLWSTPTCPYQ